MPFRDGTGPSGAGPMTGRGLGRCTGYSSPDYTKNFRNRYFGKNFGYGRRFGYGRCFGRGYWRASWSGRRDYPQSETETTKKEEKEMLNEELNYLKGDMESIKKRIQELEGKKKK